MGLGILSTITRGATVRVGTMTVSQDFHTFTVLGALEEFLYV